MYIKRKQRVSKLAFIPLTLLLVIFGRQIFNDPPAIPIEQIPDNREAIEIIEPEVMVPATDLEGADFTGDEFIEEEFIEEETVIDESEITLAFNSEESEIELAGNNSVKAIIKSASRKHGVSYKTMYCLAYAESGLNPKAVSPRNRNGTRDFGLYQFNSIHRYPKASMLNATWSANKAASWIKAGRIRAWYGIRSNNYKRCMAR